MYHIFWGKFALFEGNRVEKYAKGRNIFGVHRFLMEADGLLEVLGYLKFRKACGFVSFCTDAFNY